MITQDAYATIDPSWTPLPPTTKPQTLNFLMIAHSLGMNLGSEATSSTFKEDQDPESTLTSLLPFLSYSLTSGSYIDESLGIIITFLSHLTKKNPISGGKPYVSASITSSLSEPLTGLSAHHPDKKVRLQAWKALGMLLGLTEGMAKLGILKGLVGGDGNKDDDAKGMGTGMPLKTASVGLVREAILQAFAGADAGTEASSSGEGKGKARDTSRSRDIFASPKMLQVLGPVLLKLPEDDLRVFKKESITLDVWKNEEEEHAWVDEMKRLSECLGVYYVLVLRDVENEVCSLITSDIVRYYVDECPL
jgi:hypothetical protein